MKFINGFTIAARAGGDLTTTGGRGSGPGFGNVFQSLYEAVQSALRSSLRFSFYLLLLSS